MRNLIELILRSITPGICLGCGRIGVIVCNDCIATLAYPDRCFNCKKLSLGALTCTKCKTKTPITAQCVVTGHEGLGKKLVHSTKYGASREGADLMGRLISERLPYLDKETIVVPVPTSNSRKRQRSFDQAERMAQAIARHRKLDYDTLIYRITKTHQVGATRKDRILHMQGAFSVRTRSDLRGVTVVLVDDVATTGATIESAARSVREFGASRVIAALFARAD
jgi:ComF family protein